MKYILSSLFFLSSVLAFGDGRVQCGSLKSQYMPAPVAYCALLPPSYDADPARKFPVLYYLHGLGGDQSFLVTSGGWNMIGPGGTGPGGTGPGAIGAAGLPAAIRAGLAVLGRGPLLAVRSRAQRVTPVRGRGRCIIRSVSFTSPVPDWWPHYGPDERFGRGWPTVTARPWPGPEPARHCTAKEHVLQQTKKLRSWNLL